MINMKYSKEILSEAVVGSSSISQVLRKLGLKEAGGTHSLISRRIREYNIDISHFLGKRSGLGKKSKLKKTWKDILVKRAHGTRCKAHQLRRALIEIGRKYVCELCGTEPWWNGKKLRLHVDHKNGDWLDDREENIRFICPNCHSQTKGYSGSQDLTDIDGVTRYSKHYRDKNSERINTWRRENDRKNKGPNFKDLI